MCHTAFDSEGDALFCFICCNYKEISLDFGAGSSGFHVSHLVPAQTRWSFAAIRGHRSARRLCSFFFFSLNPSFLKCSGLTVYDSLFLCACLLRVYRCVHAFQLYINWLPLYYQKGLKLQTANNNLCRN